MGPPPNRRPAPPGRGRRRLLPRRPPPAGTPDGSLLVRGLAVREGVARVGGPDPWGVAGPDQEGHAEGGHQNGADQDERSALSGGIGHEDRLLWTLAAGGGGRGRGRRAGRRRRRGPRDRGRT